MGKAYTLDKIVKIGGYLKENYKVFVDNNPIPYYYVLRWEWRGRGKNGGATKDGLEYVNVGSPRQQKFTPKEIYNAVNTHLGSVVATKYKNLYTNLIDVNVTI